MTHFSELVEVPEFVEHSRDQTVISTIAGWKGAVHMGTVYEGAIEYHTDVRYVWDEVDFKIHLGPDNIRSRVYENVYKLISNEVFS